MSETLEKKSKTAAALTPKKRGRPKKTTAIQPEPAQPSASPVKSKKSVKTPAPETIDVKKPEKKPSYHYAIGRRKTALAKVRTYENVLEFTVNKKPLLHFFRNSGLQKVALAPLSVLGLEKRLGFEIFVSGGGVHAQAEAIRHGIARALVKRNPEDKSALKKFGFLTRDPRVKERKKPGLKGARRAPQWAKR